MAEHVYELPFDDVAPREGRRVVASCLEEQADLPTGEAVLVVASEMVTHALQCTRPPLHLRCIKHGKAMFVYVDHGGPYVPLQGTAKRIVEEIASQLRIRPAPGRLGFQASL